MKTIITTLAFIGLTFQLTAQLQYQKVYNWTYDNYGYSLEKVSNGYLLLGSTKTASNQLDVLLIKTDLNGDTLWTKTYGGANDDVGYCLKKTADKGFIITGYTKSFGIGLEDVYLIKVDSVGVQQWTQTFGADSTDIGYSVEQLSNYGFIISGYTKSFGGGLEDVYLIRTDSLGNSIWDIPYGGGCSEIGRSVTATSDNGFVIAGQTNGYAESGWLIHTIKVNSAGSLIWSKTYDFSLHQSNRFRYGYSIIENSSQEYVITGSVGQNAFIGDAQVLILRLDSSGSINSSKIYSWNSGDCTGQSILQTSDGGYIIGGTMGNYYPAMMKVDNSENSEWTMVYSNTMGANGRGFSVIVTDDNGYAFIGYSANSGDTSIYLIKTDDLGYSGSSNDASTTGNGAPYSHTSYVYDPDTSCSPTGLEEFFTFESFTIYPNPLIKCATMQFDNSKHENHILTLYDTQGRLARTITNIRTGKVEIERKNLSSGLYFFQLRTDRQVVATGKLMIE